MLRDDVTQGWDIRPEGMSADREHASSAFVERFVDNDLVTWQKAGQFWSRNQVAAIQSGVTHEETATTQSAQNLVQRCNRSQDHSQMPT